MTRFFKLSGGGNDFIALAEPEGEIPADAPSKARIRSWCRRGLSLGADGVFTLHRRPEGGIRMHHFNPDGGRAGLCLNGTRCAARLAFHLGWASHRAVLMTDAGPVEAMEEPPGEGSAEIRLELAVPESPPRRLRLEAEGESYHAWWVRVGVPHLVLEWPAGLAGAPVEAVGKLLVHHPEVEPEGANVNFVTCPEPGRLEIRTYERGVYAETLACGSGVLASAWALFSTGAAEPPLEVRTAGGFLLRVGGEGSEGRLRSWFLSGDARLIAEGSLHPGAEELPDPPRWSAGTAPGMVF